PPPPTLSLHDALPILGVAYKKDIDDIRESPALDVIRLLQRRGAAVSYHDPHVRKLRDEAIDLASLPLTPETVSTADCVVIVTDQDRKSTRLNSSHVSI